MRRSPCTIIVLFVLATNFLEAQESKYQFSESAALSTSDANATILRLLQESHNLVRQLPVSSPLINLFAGQAEMVSRLRPDLGREWANEVFTLSFQTKADERSLLQNRAMRILIRSDPGRAVELLHSLNIEDPVADWAISPPEMQLVDEVFRVLVARDGANALPLLQQEAERLGVQGHYPYAALGYAAMQATTKDWGSDNQRAIRVLRSVFEPAFARYSQNAHGYLDDVEFGKMLQVLSGGLPLVSVQAALRMLVKNLLATDTRKYQFEAEVYTNDGQTAKVHNTIDATILLFGTLINRDPDLAQELGSTRPELQTALEYTKEGRERLLSIRGQRPQILQSADAAYENRMDALHLSHINPEAAIAKAERLPHDDKRASTMLEVACGIAGDYPERARELVAEAQSENKPIDDQLSLNLIAAQAFVAAAQNKKDELHELLERGFKSAHRIILQQQKTGDIQFVAGLVPLVQIGMQNDPDLTIAFIESLSPSYLKAQLLGAGASALSLRMRLPPSSRPQQRAEKPDQ
jgi:hypothetical protein